MPVRNTDSWPTASLGLLQPTLSASNILQTADKARQKLQQLQNISAKASSPPHSLAFGDQWGTTDLKILLQMKTGETSSKECKSSGASLTGIDLIFKNSFIRLHWLQTLCVTLFLSIVRDLNRVTYPHQ